jgi:hypothetical protein
VVQFLLAQLEQEEVMELLTPLGPFPIWSPFDAIDAADSLLKALAEDKLRGKKA